jgi:hypothetical protein
VPKVRWIRISTSILVWVALILTYSRGALIAVLLTMAIWAIVMRARSALVLSGLCLAVVCAFLVFQPFLARRFEDKPPVKAFAAEYSPQYNKLRRRPGELDNFVVRVKNVGSETWTKTDEAPFTLTYRWYNPEQLKVLGNARSFFIIPVTLRPGESVDINASFLTPAEPGLYLMTWDISQHGKGWFSGEGVSPGLVEVDVKPGGKPESRNVDLSRWYLHPVSRMIVANVTATRTELWRAAIDLFREHPIFGAGPDNFRLLYGPILHIDHPNTKLRTHSLYLELLSGSGLIGLLAFGLMMATVRRSDSLAVIALVIFLVHGFVDIFLSTTPIYFAFWILLGLAQRDYDDTAALRSASAT